MKAAWHLLLILLLAGCQGQRGTRPAAEPAGQDPYTSYASGFRVLDAGPFRLLTVLNPWQNSRNVSFSCVLAHEGEVLPDSVRDLPCIRTPVRRVIALSTTHVAMIDQLGQSASIVGLSGSDLIYSPAIRTGISSGKVLDIGYGQGLDYESIVELDPDVLFIYGVEGQVVATVEKLSELGIPVVFCAEYLESHPLGKAEWIKFFSLFYEREQEAADFFQRIDSSYHSLAQLAAGAGEKPWVLTGLPWKDTWYMAGGRSFAARLIEDAGGEYLWNDNPSTEAVPLDLESVYLRAVNASVWINPGAATSLEDIGRLDERFMDLAVVQNRQVYNNDQRKNSGGGNDYWESGTVRPDLVLADLIRVLHPDLLADHRFVYYRQLK